MAYLDQVLARTDALRKQRSQGSNVGSIMELIRNKRAIQAAQAPATSPVQAAAQRAVASVAGAGTGQKGLRPEFDTALAQMIRDSGGKISVGSGYRSIDEQAKIYNLWKQGKHPAPLVAKPGSSNHNFGLAADLKFADAATRKWAHQNAGKYGLVFPMGNEPWHVEPVGAKSKR